VIGFDLRRRRNKMGNAPGGGSGGQMAMLYRGIEYSVVQGIVRRQWKWAATVSGIKISGYDSTRDEAIGNARKKPSSALSRSNASSRS
jgi:hypothetical protein